VTNGSIVIVGIFAAPRIRRRKQGPAGRSEDRQGQPYAMGVRMRGNSGGLTAKHRGVIQSNSGLNRRSGIKAALDDWQIGPLTGAVVATALSLRPDIGYTAP
jgi:hypothetical protein